MLRQLALLEAVADESSRMTPTLLSRELPTATNINHTPRVRHPGPSASVPPPTHHLQGEFPPPFGQAPAGYQLPSSSQYTGFSQQPPPFVDDVFQVRPRSSQFFTHDYSAQNTQDQLLSLLTGPPPPGTSTGIPHTYPHPSYSQGYLPTHYQPHLSAKTFPPVYHPPSSHMITVPHTAIPSVSAQVMPARTFLPPGHPFPPPLTSRTPVNNSAQLLSLLNNNNPAALPPHVNAGYR